MSEFKVGDLVKLKSGGPAMIVTTLWEHGTVSCFWIADDGAHQANNLDPNWLVPVEPVIVPGR